MIDVKEMLAIAIEHNASDVHVNVSMPPVMRVDTNLIVMDFPVVDNDTAGEMVLSIVGPEKYKKFEANRDIDFSTKTDDGSRFRVNAHY